MFYYVLMNENPIILEAAKTLGVSPEMLRAISAAVQKVHGDTAKRICDVHPGIVGRVQADYTALELAGKKLNHHDIEHAKRVGEIARQVALDEWQDAHLSHVAGAAGLVHNADRIIQAQRGIGRRDVPRDDVITLVKKWAEGEVGGSDLELVIDAVLRHDGKNETDDSKVKIALQDGDRIVNLDGDLFPRSGQYYADLPVVDYKHFLASPTATYRSPESVLRDINYSRDWADPASNVCVRTRLGMQMAKQRVAMFDLYFMMLKGQLAQEGLIFPESN